MDCNPCACDENTNATPNNLEEGTALADVIAGIVSGNGECVVCFHSWQQVEGLTDDVGIAN